jgi:hydroxymethylpyrimidine/phosphomethylpyrimidine kinase
MHVALTIAGSDSGGGAGIQADLKTFHSFGVFGTSAITAITAQNTLRVASWEPVAPDLVRAQIDAVVVDLRPAAVKSGMLGEEKVVRVVADAIRHHELGTYVLDPVMVATSGDLLIRPNAISAIVEDLLPLALVVTPNSHEATVLTGLTVSSENDMIRAAQRLLDLGAGAALVKGGHVSRGEEIADLLFDGEPLWIRHKRIETTSTHGTGCTLSAAITAGLARGGSLRDAARAAVEFVHEAIATAPGLGAGHGPLNYFARGSSVTNARTSR